MIHRLILILLVIVLAMVGVALWRQAEHRPPSLSELVDALRSDKVNLSIENSWSQSVTFTTGWKDSHGVAWSVTTTQKPDESYEDFKKRHLDAVYDLQQDHPPV